MAGTFDSDSTVEFVKDPPIKSVEVNDSNSFDVVVDIQNAPTLAKSPVNGQLIVAGTPVAQDSGPINIQEGETTIRLSHAITPSNNPRDYPRFIEYRVDVEITSLNDGEEEISTDTIELEVTNPAANEATPNILDDNEVISRRERTSPRGLNQTYDDFTPFAIKGISFEQDADYVEFLFDEENGGLYEIEFEYANPNVSIDGAGRFSKHEIIGGSTVRQKVGEDPLNISINGICKRQTANQIDALRDCRVCQIFTDRIPVAADSILVQIGSTSTEPLEDGGAADLVEGQFLYSFSINAIEVDA